MSIISLDMYYFHFFLCFYYVIKAIKTYYGTLIPLICIQIYYVTDFFRQVLYQLFVSVFIMTIKAIKTYYETLKPLIRVQIYYMHYDFRCILGQFF